MISWNCPDCMKRRNAACAPVCLPADRIDPCEFKSARIAAERDAATAEALAAAGVTR